MKTKSNDIVFSPMFNIGGDESNGLTKREYFAAMAMTGFFATYNGAMNDPNPAHIATTSVKYADALISELNKEQL